MKRIILVLLLPVLTAAPLMANDGFQQGKEFGNSNKTMAKDQGLFNEQKAEENIKEVAPGYTNDPPQRSTYMKAPPRAQGDERIEFCRTENPENMDEQTRNECDATNFLVANAQKENPYAVSEKNDPMFSRFRQAQQDASSMDPNLCKATATTPDFEGAREESCSESLGTKLFECVEDLRITQHSGRQASTEGTVTASLNYSFVSNSAYRAEATNQFHEESPTVNLAILLNLQTGVSQILKSDVQVPWRRQAGQVLFANPFPFRYEGFEGTSSDPIRRIFAADFTPARSAAIFQKTPLPNEESLRALVWTNGTDSFHGDRFQDGRTLYPDKPPCDSTDCFAREQISNVPVPVRESGSILGYGEPDSEVFYQVPVYNPERPLTFTGASGLVGEGSRFGSPFVIRGNPIQVPFYAGLRSAYAIYNQNTKAIFAFSEGYLDGAGNLIGEIYAPDTQNMVCRVNFGRILLETSFQREHSEQVTLNDTLTPDWFQTECTDSEAQAILARLNSAGGNLRTTTAVRGSIIVLASSARGHLTKIDTQYSYCPSYLSGTSIKRTPPTGTWNLTETTLTTKTYTCSVSPSSTLTTPLVSSPPSSCEMTDEEKEDYLTQRCTGGRINQSQIPSSSTSVSESYAFFATSFLPSGLSERFIGSCEQYKTQGAVQ